MRLTKINLYDNLAQKEMGKLVGGANETTQPTGLGSGVLAGAQRSWSSDTEYGYMSLKGTDPEGESSWEFVRTSTTYCFDDGGSGSSTGCPDGTEF
jgi:hypothetical protein